MNNVLPAPDQLHSFEEPVKKFFNKAQRDAMAVSAHDEYIVAARGTGKSEGIDARFILRNVWAMPGSTGALISPTYAKAWGNTLPAICHALSSWGYMEGTHYYVGRKAPIEKNFKNPKRLPLRDAWSNCFHFWNGTIMVVLSFNQGMSANSMSLDWIIGPEAKFLNYDKIKSEVNPANRGNRQYFGDCPWHHSVLYSTDMPTSKMGKWILDKREEMSDSHINFIRNLYKEIKQLEAKPEQTDYCKRRAKELRADLNLARRYQRPLKPLPSQQFEYTVFYGEYDIFDNLEVVGSDFIWQMYRDSPPLIWRTAFMNERLFRVPNGFYSALTDNHFYIPDDNGKLEALGNNWTKPRALGVAGQAGRVCMIISRAPIRISFFGGGTDYPEYFLKHGGAVLGTAIDKFSYVTASPFLSHLFDYSIRVSYRKVELARDVREIEHAVFRECLKLCGFEKDIELHNVADLPAFTGLGSSSAVTVALLHALHSFKGEFLNPVTAKQYTFNGVVLQNANAGYGYFLGTNTAGKVWIH